MLIFCKNLPFIVTVDLAQYYVHKGNGWYSETLKLTFKTTKAPVKLPFSLLACFEASH